MGSDGSYEGKDRMTEVHTCWIPGPHEPGKEHPTAVFVCTVHCHHGIDLGECWVCAGVALVEGDEVPVDGQDHEHERDLGEIAKGGGGGIADRRARRIQRETDKLLAIARSGSAEIARLRATTPGWPDNPIDDLGPMPLTKDGQARMARARRAAGVSLSDRDRRALDG